MKYLYIYTGLLIAALLSACGPKAQAVNVYSARHYEVDRQLFGRFTEQTGIAVNLISADSQPLLARIEEEKDQAQADLFITVDVPQLHRAKARGLTVPIESPKLEQLAGPRNRDGDKYWYAISSRVRIIAVGKGYKGPLPQSYLDLAKPEYKGQILVRSGTSAYNISWVAALVEAYGEGAVRTFLKGFTANFARAPQGNDRKQVSDIYGGRGSLALVNSYYLGRMLNSQDSEERRAAESVRLIFPNPVHRNISGGALIKGAKHPAEAVKLLEFLVSEEAQKLITEENYEFPVNSNIAPNSVFTNWGGVPPTEDLAGFRWGGNQEIAIRLIDESGWK